MQTYQASYLWRKIFPLLIKAGSSTLVITAPFFRRSINLSLVRNLVLVPICIVVVSNIWCLCSLFLWMWGGWGRKKLKSRSVNQLTHVFENVFMMFAAEFENFRRQGDSICVIAGHFR
jgi:hypothetical protein